MDLPQLVKDDLSDLLPQLASQGLEAVTCQFSPDSFGNYMVQFQGGICALEITRDRGQYLLGGDHARLETLGLWRALENKQELAEGLRLYLAAAV